MISVVFDDADIYSEARRTHRENFRDAPIGGLEFSGSALGTRDLTECTAIAVYGNGLGALAHGYSAPDQKYTSQFDMPRLIRDKFSASGYGNRLYALVSAGSDFAFDTLLRLLLDSDIHVVGAHVSNQNRNVIFEPNRKNMQVYVKLPDLTPY